MLQYIEKQYKIKDVLPGMIIGEDISDHSGKNILSRGVKLTGRIIQLLENWNITQVMVLECVSKATDEYSLQASEKQESFEQDYFEAVQNIKRIFESTKACKHIPIKELRESVEPIVQKLLAEPGIFNYLYLIKRNEHYLYHHSLDVAIIAGVLAKWLELSGQDVDDIVLAGLMHDIGKLLVSDEILEKCGQLTQEEMEEVKLHSLYGAKLIKKLKYISSKVNVAVLQHHERIDGSGYPLKATCGNIYLPAKIIAIADVYDAITSNRAYKQRISPFDAVAVLEEMMGKLDISICMTFLNNLKECFIGNNVRLSNGQDAKVIYWSKFKNSMPIVQTNAGECIALEQVRINIVDIVH